MSYQDLVASFSSKMTDADLESAVIDELKASIGPMRVPVKAYAEIAKLAQGENLSVGNFVLKTVSDLHGLNIPLSEGKGRKAKNLSQEEKTAATRVANAQKAAQVARILAELGVNTGS